MTPYKIHVLFRGGHELFYNITKELYNQLIMINLHEFEKISIKDINNNVHFINLNLALTANIYKVDTD